MEHGVLQFVLSLSHLTPEIVRGDNGFIESIIQDGHTLPLQIWFSELYTLSEGILRLRLGHRLRIGGLRFWYHLHLLFFEWRLLLRACL